MAGSTTNLGLTKPTYSEDADIAVINTNMDTLDSKIGAVGSTSLQAQITSANEAISNITLPTRIYCSSQSDFETKANTLAGNLSNGEIASVAFGFSSGMIFNGTSAWGYINKYSATRWNMILTSYDDSTYVVNIQYNNGTFKYTDLNSKLNPVVITSSTSLASLTTSSASGGKGITIFTCTGDLATDMPTGINAYGTGYVVDGANYKLAYYENSNSEVYVGRKTFSGNSWTWEQLALNDKKANLQKGQLSTADTTLTFSLIDSCLVYVSRTTSGLAAVYAVDFWGVKQVGGDANVANITVSGSTITITRGSALNGNAFVTVIG